VSFVISQRKDNKVVLSDKMPHSKVA